ncbi:hypothetical protein OY671_010552, partial [Metschnikowia pulcherrima]
CDKPIIAAVNGSASGGGFESASACDIIIAVESAGFGSPEPSVGAVASGGGVHRLARQIGSKQAMGMILASRRVDAREGERSGFVTEVVPDGDSDAAVERWTAAISKGAPLSVRASKQAVMRGSDEPDSASASANQARYPAFGTWFNSADAAEGPRAFAEKRAPEWQGR